MSTRLRVGLGLALMLCASPVLAQDATPRYTADDLANILRKDVQPSFTADQFAAILQPKSKIRTRSLVAGEGSEPGSAGSGVVPDLRIQFPSASAELTSEAKATLAELGKALQRDELSTLRFEIGGHTDAKGSDKYNQQLSQKRAASVVSYLTKDFGIAPDRLRAEGYGEKALADPASPDSGVNRRVEVRTLQ